MKFKIVKIDGKNVYKFVRIGCRGGIEQFHVLFHDGTYEDMSYTDIVSRAECEWCNIADVLG